MFFAFINPFLKLLKILLHLYYFSNYFQFSVAGNGLGGGVPAIAPVAAPAQPSVGGSTGGFYQGGGNDWVKKSRK